MAQMRVGNHIPLKFGIVVLTFVCLAAQAIGQRGASQNAEIDDGRQLYHAVIVRSCHISVDERSPGQRREILAFLRDVVSVIQGWRDKPRRIRK